MIENYDMNTLVKVQETQRFIRSLEDQNSAQRYRYEISKKFIPYERMKIDMCADQYFLGQQRGFTHNFNHFNCKHGSFAFPAFHFILLLLVLVTKTRLKLAFLHSFGIIENGVGFDLVLTKAICQTFVANF